MINDSIKVWICKCGAMRNTNFCPECGQKRVDPNRWICSCGNENTGNFCTNCGEKRPEKYIENTNILCGR